MSKCLHEIPRILFHKRIQNYWQKKKRRKMSNLQHSSTVSDTIYGKNVKDHDVSADNIKHKTAIENNEMDNFANTCGTIIT